MPVHYSTDGVCGEHVNSDFKCTRKTSYMTKVVMLPIRMFCISTKHLRKKICAKLTPHILNNDNFPCLCCCSPSISIVEKRRRMNSLSDFSWWMGLWCIHLTQKWSKKGWHGGPPSHQDKACIVQWGHYESDSSSITDLCQTISCHTPYLLTHNPVGHHYAMALISTNTATCLMSYKVLRNVSVTV
jgi:hypothetical protein